jgi:1,4-alpha-glucan branching enzyme
MRSILLTIVLTIIAQLPMTTLASWQDSFYTDDSRYYLKLGKDKFQQRFRVARQYCQRIAGATLLFKQSKHPIKSEILRGEQLEKWPTPYGLNNYDHCWFELTANKIDLNSPLDNQYLIAIETDDQQTIYFEAPSHSLLPAKRLVSHATHWHQLGGMGATPVVGGGFFFKLWEPVVDGVDLFINNQNKHSMIKDGATGQMRSYVLYLENITYRDRYHYQFLEGGFYQTLLVGNNNRKSPIKIDPMALALEYDSKGGQHDGYINPRVKLTGLKEQYRFSFDHMINSRAEKEPTPLIIYQLWPLAFNPQNNNGIYRPGTFKDTTAKIDYLKNLGINAVEFLPLNETRFNASWGYALDSLTLIENNYGERSDLMELVDQMHRQGIKVIFDIVINHINNDLLREPLSPTVDVTKFYSGNTGWGPKPDFSKIMVCKLIVDALLSLQREFHLDGYRFDMIEYVYRNSPDGYRFIQEMNHLLKGENPNFHLSAEQLPDVVMVTWPIKDGGLGFDTQWNDKFKNAFELEFDHYRSYQRGLDTRPIVASLLGYSDQTITNEHHFGPPMRTVNYLGSHDFIANRDPLLRIISDYESYEWVDHLHFFRVRPLSDPENPHTKFREIHNDFTHATLRASYGVLFTKPGHALFFQGEELAQDLNLENEWSYLTPLKNNTTPSKNIDLNRFVGSHRMPWEHLAPSMAGPLHFLSSDEQRLFTGHHQFFKEMIDFKKRYPLINQQDAYNVTTLNSSGNLISYELGRDDQHFFVILNLGDDIPGEWIDFPGHSKQWWHEKINSSAQRFGGQDNRFVNVISNQGHRSNIVRAKGPSITIFQAKDRAQISTPLYLRTSIQQWQALPTLKLTELSESEGELYGTTLTIKSDTEIEFKLGSSDWEIELGRERASLRKGDDYLSYVQNGMNVKTHLTKGRYRFIFNLRSFRYHFIKE